MGKKIKTADAFGIKDWKNNGRKAATRVAFVLPDEHHAPLEFECAKDGKHVFVNWTADGPIMVLKNSVLKRLVKMLT